MDLKHGGDSPGFVTPVGVGQGFMPPGTQLLEYRIEGVLGHGGFGITYLARDTMLDKPVAIKEYLPAHLAVRADSHVSVRTPADQHTFDWGRKQFLKEAQILARFTHPNLVPVHRYFEANRTAYFVMSYVEGETLGNHLKRDPEPTEAWLRSVILPILSGLKSVHRAGFLHRDIKPDNIVLKDNLTPVLIDFGAARVNVDSVTRSAVSVLTAGYAPLEQYSNDGHQGPWTDLYALAAVAYRALSGHKPPEAVNRVQKDALVPARVAGHGRYSPEFLDAIDWALAVQPQDRPQSVAQLRKALVGQMRQRRAANSVSTVPGATGAASVHEPAEPVNWLTTSAPLLGVGILVALLYFGGRATAPAPTVVEAPAPEMAEPAPAPAAAAATPAPAQPVPAQPAPAGPAPTPPVKAKGTSVADAPRRASALTPVAQLEALSTFQDCAACPVMTVLPAGSFVMGQAAGKGVSPWETPPREITLGNAFAIGRYEVTGDQYAACASAGRCRPTTTPAGKVPAIYVSWADAQAYAAWLSRETGRHYRLPSEAEWEYAARSGTPTARFWGTDAGRACVYGNGACRKSELAIAAVGNLKPNWFDLYDTAGNVWELTADCWRDSLAAAPPDGSAVDTPPCGQRAARGGSWKTPPEALRSTVRTPVDAAHRSDTLGFRVAADR